jgi:hypothetical protein
MGMDQKVVFPPANMPTWSQFADMCTKHQVPVQLRMIDGELALPDETPPHDWRELRVGVPAGMVTLRHDADGITLVIWGNADDRLRREWNALTWAIGRLTGGAIHNPSATGLSAADFAKIAELPANFAT